MLQLALRSNRPSFYITIPNLVLFMVGLLGLGLLALSGLAIYRLIDAAENGARNGDKLAFTYSSQTREQELQRLIDRDNSRVTDLQKENQERETAIAGLQARLMTMGNSLSDLKTALPTLKLPNQAFTPGSKPGTVNYDYNSQLQKLETQLNSLNQYVAERRAGLDLLQQSFNDYNAELVRLTGREPLLPGPIRNIRDAQALRPPDILPGDGLLTSPFGWRDSPFHPGTRGWHDGIDIACRVGQPVRATKTGIITFASMDGNGYGLRVDISHENGWLTFYGHNSQILVRVGQNVNKGDIIALCGNTGASTGPHIHYGLHYNGVMTDPARYLPFTPKWQ